MRIFNTPNSCNLIYVLAIEIYMQLERHEIISWTHKKRKGRELIIENVYFIGR